MRELWVPSSPEDTMIFRFIQRINQKYNLNIGSYSDLYNYSISNLEQFWSECFETAGFIQSGSYTRSIDESQYIDAIPRWFEGITINFAENLLFSRDDTVAQDAKATNEKENGKIAVTQVGEGGVDVRHFDWATLRHDTSSLASALQNRGLNKGDRVFAVASNSYQTLTVFLATTWVGGIFSSTSPDMGIEGILQRAKQISPKLVFVDDSTRYNGKDFDLMSKVRKIVAELSKEASFQNLVLLPRGKHPASIDLTSKIEPMDEFLSCADDGPPSFERLPFHSPCLISYSSGTTGEPKCIVHSVGGLLINSYKEGILHGDLRADDVVLQYTTTGWIMYVACVTALLPGARTVLYDGSPFFPNATSFIKLLSQEKVTSFGTSPRWMFEMRKLGISPREIADLCKVKTVTSTGMVLSDQLFEWFYDTGFPSHVRLANMSGGTDIAGCFALGNPISPLYVGGCQGPSLGVAIAIYNEGTEGKAELAVPGAAGELVAYMPFPNVPVSFWNDILPQQSPKSKYFSSYFAKYEHVWAHGDFVSIHPITKAVLFHGRSDGVLNPSGIRFGSSEIYSVMERHFSEIMVDSICVGQRRASDSDETVLLFVQMKPGYRLTRELVETIKQAIRKDLSNRHVPKHVFEAPDLPVTATFKKVELPIKHIVSGRKVRPSGTIINPSSLDYFYQFADIENYVMSAKL
ncbi:acetoacetate-CoA ligase [Fusarium oxysporum f. sp. melonis 26406]|uniref:Acetoacetate-CoA ligase n=1 Tax=Fusarium oxysporum f. sp. melonis 26406 TaxID=1089452 RepID=W9ZDU7_FUSOX|nr:acetoacetate-CoA ligase [Fusarium oxysporum f. sp. melonis 26406]